MVKNNSYDEIAVSELKLYIENDGDIYRQRLTPIYKNLKNKEQKGIYEPEKAQKLYKYAVDDGAKKYKKDFGSNFSVNDRKEVAKRFEEENRGYHDTLV